MDIHGSHCTCDCWHWLFPYNSRVHPVLGRVNLYCGPYKAYNLNVLYIQSFPFWWTNLTSLMFTSLEVLLPRIESTLASGASRHWSHHWSVSGMAVRCVANLKIAAWESDRWSAPWVAWKKQLGRRSVECSMGRLKISLATVEGGGFNVSLLFARCLWRYPKPPVQDGTAHQLWPN